MSTNLKFYRYATLPEKLTTGGIYFDTTNKVIKVATGESTVETYGGSITDVTFSNNVLTISKVGVDPIVLDFSDTASASGVNAILKALRSDLGAAAGKVSEAYGSDTILTGKTSMVAGDKALADAIRQEVTDRGTAITSLKSTVDAYTVNGQAISGNPVLDGADVKLDGYTKAETASAIAATDTVNAALGKLEKGLEDAKAGGLNEVEAGNGISVSTKASNKQTISANVASGEKVLAASADGLNTTLSISYNSSDRKIYLKGINDAEVSSFDASAFIKDGMLYGQKVFKATATTMTITIKEQSHEYTDLTVGNTYLAMCFSNGEATATTYSWDIIDVTSLVDVYTAGDGLQLNSGNFSIKLADGSESYLSVDANGLKLSGVATAISTAKSEAISDVRGAEGDAWATAKTVYAAKAVADAAQTAAEAASAKVDTEIGKLDATNNVSDADAGITVKVDEVNGIVSKPVVTVTPGSVATGNSSVVTGGAVYTAVDDAKTALKGVYASATKDDETIAGAKRYADDKASAAETAAKAVANEKVASVSKGTDGTYVSVTVNNTDAKNPTISVSDTIQAVADADTTHKGLAEASDVKGYVADEIAKLDATVSQAAGTDGLALSVTEVDGKLTAVSGSIAANTYDAYGAASTAETNAKAYADGLWVWANF